MDADSTRHLVDAAIAAGLGLFIGLEREHRDVAPPAPAGAPEDPGHLEGRHDLRPDHLGVRTFALVALLGWLASLLEGSVRGLTLVGLAVVGVLLGLQYVRSWHRGSGITTEIAAILTFGLGYLCARERLLAVALAVGVTLLLFSKPWVRRLVPRISRAELTATLQLALMLAIVLPLLPAEPADPWGVLPPRKIGLFVVMIAGLNFVGYVLLRTFGRTLGAGLAGLVGGLASSTAVTAAMAQQSRSGEAMVAPSQLATFLANAVMFGRVVVVAAVLSRGVAERLVLPMVAMGGVMLLGAIWKWRSLRHRTEESAGEIPLANPFALLPALKWGALLSVILVVTAVAREELGTRGLLITAAVSGFADVDAITIAASRQAAGGDVLVGAAVLAITVATISNTITKGVIACVSGRRAFGRDVAVVFGVAVVVGIVVAILA